MKPFIIKMLFCTLVLLNFQVSAHHSAVVFDETKTQLIKGEVTRFVLRNPHMILSVDVPDENGELVEWKLEGQGIGAMQAMGFDRGSISAGDNITVKISPMRNGTPGGLVLGLIGADGRAYNMEVEEEEQRQVYPALMTYVPPPAGETWQMREEKTRPPQLPIISNGTTPGENPVDGKTMGALDPNNLAIERHLLPLT